MTPFVLVAVLISVAAAFDCSIKELEQYDFQSIKGIYSDSILRNTPPSKYTSTWAVGICQNLDGQADCPSLSDICGTGHVKVDDKDTLSEVIAFNNDLKHEFTPFDNENESGISVAIKELIWGDSKVDAKITFICDESKSSEINKLLLQKWDGKVFEAKFPTPAACARDTKKNPKQPSEDGGESWGWFTWIFIFMVLFLSIYIIGGAWFQYNKGNSIDFQSALKEVLENFIDLMRGLPSFVKEVAEKVTGNSSRNEYSAV